MDSLTRRTFFERMASFTAGGILIGGLPAATLAQREPHVSFPTAPRDRIAVASYPFRAYFDIPGNRDRDRSLPGMDLTGFASMVIAKFGVHSIEPYGPHFPSLEPAYLDTLHTALRRAGVGVVNIAASLEESLYDADAPVRNQAIARAKKWVDTAVAIGSPSIRPHIASTSNSSPNVDRAADSLRKVTEYAAAKNVVVHLENDDPASEDAFFIVKVIEAVKHPYLRALPDFANSALVGGPESNRPALEALFPHAYGICHVKAGETDEHGKEFRIDLKQAFDILKSSGYRGYCSMEFDAPGDPNAPTAELIKQTTQNLS
jgi:sugar phosphate isomerase/epimerase